MSKEYMNMVQENRSSGLFFDRKAQVQNAKCNLIVIILLYEKTVTSVIDICDVFANFFEEVYRQDLDIVETDPTWTHKVSSAVHDRSLVFNYLKKLKHKNARGPDSVSPEVLKNSAASLSTPLCYIFNVSLSTSVFPQLWKQSFITTEV